MPRGTSPYDAARLQGRLWTPSVLGASNALQIEPWDFSTLSGATGISAIRDKSGYGRNFTAATTSKEPVWTNGALVFNGTTSGLATATISRTAIFPDLYSGIYYCVVTIANAGMILGWHSANTSRLNNEGTSTINWPNLTDGLINTWSESLSATVRKIMMVRRNATTAVVRLNGRQVKSNAGTASFANDTAQMWMGHYFTSSLFADCKIWALGMSSDSSDATMLKFEGYLAHSLGMAGDLRDGHIYSNAPPLIGA